MDYQKSSQAEDAGRKRKAMAESLKIAYFKYEAALCGLSI